jgi:hypothetical protein
LTLQRDLPLIISDVDEVVLQFVDGLDDFLRKIGFWLDIRSFALHGNIKHLETDEVVANDHATKLLERFFVEGVEDLSPVPNAVASLKELSGHAQVLMLSNVPAESAEKRARCLAGHGMDYPLVANRGLKGPAVAYIAEKVDAPIFFLDDIPHNISSVAQNLDRVRLFHFVADPRLGPLIDPAEDCHHRIDDWVTAKDTILYEITNGQR